MAQLFRLTNFHDSTQTTTFTFVLPPQTAIKDGPPEILSREFPYGGVRWKLLLSKRDTQHLSPYLELATKIPGMTVLVDYTFMLLNQDSFTQNEKFTEKQRLFNDQHSRHGKRTFVSLEDLQRRKGFMTVKREFLLELTLRAPKISYQYYIQLQTPLGPRDLDYQRYDTEKFSFGDHEWQLSFCPNMESEPRSRHLVQIRRSTRSEILTKIVYRVTLGSRPGKQQFKSDKREETMDFSGNGEGIYLTGEYLRFTETDGRLWLNVDLISCVSISHLRLNLLNEGGGKPPAAQCLDKDKQGWSLVGNMGGECLSFVFYYTGLTNIPMGYLRYVSWNCKILPSVRTGKSQSATNGPFEGYYAYTGEHDKGFPIRTSIGLREIHDPRSPWRDEVDGKVTVEVEWITAQLMLNPNYSSYDDVMRRHVMQMRREVEALQTENYSLEKELHNYQLSIATKCADIPSVGNHQGNGSVSSSNGPSYDQSYQHSSSNYYFNGSPRSNNGFTYESKYKYREDSDSYSEPRAVRTRPHSEQRVSDRIPGGGPESLYPHAQTSQPYLTDQTSSSYSARSHSAEPRRDVPTESRRETKGHRREEYYPNGSERGYPRTSQHRPSSSGQEASQRTYEYSANHQRRY